LRKNDGKLGGKMKVHPIKAPVPAKKIGEEDLQKEKGVQGSDLNTPKVPQKRGDQEGFW